MTNSSSRSNLAGVFFIGLVSLSAGTLMYEVILTRLLSATCWYYLAFVSVSMGMFGMTAGALVVQLRPSLFSSELLPLRLHQSVLAMAISMPLALVIMLAIPLDMSLAVQTIVSFVLFSAVIATPFFFSGIGVCMALTRAPFATGRIYCADLAGAGIGCLAAVVLLNVFDAPSGIFDVSAILFVSAAAFADYAQRPRLQRNSLIAAVGTLLVAMLNSSSVHGIQPIWAKGHIDVRNDILEEVWNPISKVRVTHSRLVDPYLWGPSPRAPKFQKVEAADIDIDNFAATQMVQFHGDLNSLSFLRYDVTSLGAQLRHGGTAAIIGVGGGRDVLNCATNGFTRIDGIEVNRSIASITSRQLDWFSGFSRVPGLRLHVDEGRSYLTRSGQRFDLIQASLVDTWAATTAGALALSENALYTVDAWRVFYDHLKPGGIVTFSRWYGGPETTETYRLYSVAYAMLLSEGVQDPAPNLALIQSGNIATLLASNQPFGPDELARLKALVGEMEFTPLALPGQPTAVPELEKIAHSKTLAAMAPLHDDQGRDYSPTFDSSPYFFNAVHLRALPKFLASGGIGFNLQATLFLFAFLLAAVVLVLATVAIPAWRSYKEQDGSPAPAGGVIYFTSIGLGFMCIEMAMMQQLSIFLGHPIYAMVVVLSGLILSAGSGSLVSDRWPSRSVWQCRIPPLAGAALILLYVELVLPVIHDRIAAQFWARVGFCLLLIVPPGFVLGFCFPVGLRWMKALKQEQNMPWMWALNGAAGTLGSFVAMVISMETSIAVCALTACGLYLLASLSLPRQRSVLAVPSQEDASISGRNAGVPA